MIIQGKNIKMRTVELDDAEFIYEMRQKRPKTRYLSVIESDVDSQREWIMQYKKREMEANEFYFVIEDFDNNRYGLVRMYDFQGVSFCWGSWLLKDDSPKTMAIESALQVYEFGFYQLNFDKSHFDVRKENERVVAFHQRFGAELVGEDDVNYYFNFDKNQYSETKKRYKRYL